MHHEADIRDRAAILALVRQVRPDVIVHTAAQPSHDRAAAIPFDDFDTNAVGTLNLLEAARQGCARIAVHSHEHEQGVRRRAQPHRAQPSCPRAGITPTLPTRTASPRRFTIDQSKHSLFGASKVAADVMVQEYGRYFNLPTCALRGGCLTGPNHSGVELHGFLSYLVKCNLEGKRIPRVRLQGQAGARQRPFARRGAFHARVLRERRARARCTTWAAARRIRARSWRRSASPKNSRASAQQYSYVEENRAGDHICYYSDLRKMRAHYPGWDISRTLEQTIGEIVAAWRERTVAAAA